MKQRKLIARVAVILAALAGSIAIGSGTTASADTVVYDNMGCEMIQRNDGTLYHVLLNGEALCYMESLEPGVFFTFRRNDLLANGGSPTGLTSIYMRSFDPRMTLNGAAWAIRMNPSADPDQAWHRVYFSNGYYEIMHPVTKTWVPANQYVPPSQTAQDGVLDWSDLMHEARMSELRRAQVWTQPDCVWSSNGCA